MVVSVRDLVEFVLKSGDIDSAYTGMDLMERAQDGSRIHRMIQKMRTKEAEEAGFDYRKEVTLKFAYDFLDMSFVVEGRADGILVKTGQDVIIEEIKSSAKEGFDLPQIQNETHWAQAKCYAFMFATLNERSAITIWLHYYSLSTNESYIKERSFAMEELAIFFHELLEKYYHWSKIIANHAQQRDDSIKTFAFPYGSYRAGQREMAVAIYKTAKRQKKIFIQAPTGTGKTISALFPAIKWMGEKGVEKIFYLTAKTITRQAAEDAFLLMEQKGLVIKAITLTAKDKICPHMIRACNPEACTYAKGHFDRINAACEDIFVNESILDRETIGRYAYKHQVCPFEFELDMSLWVDCVICDYNYVFDPHVYLRRFFAEKKGAFLFLVDEAHNLVDRARSMYSAQVTKGEYATLKRVLRDDNADKKNKKLIKSIGEIVKYCNTVAKEMKNRHEDGTREDSVHPYVMILDEQPKPLYDLVRGFTEETDLWLAENEVDTCREPVLEGYFNALNFLKIAEFFDERYTCYAEKDRGDFALHLFCKDPSYVLAECQKKGTSTIFFSATLSPIDYYRNLLGGKEEDYHMHLPSPFHRRNLLVCVHAGITAKYAFREKGYEPTADALFTMVSAKKGNYIVFFPSYEHMNQVLDRFIAKYPDITVREQERTMSEDQREAFLAYFQEEPKRSMLAFCVMGGLFSEGIDLRGSRLIGVAVVGVGLSRMNPQGDIVSAHFEQQNGMGFAYSYLYPGMNKVLQAAGRVIRTETDRGVVLLLDNRFLRWDYQQLFPWEWGHFVTLQNKTALAAELARFWEEDL